MKSTFTTRTIKTRSGESILNIVINTPKESNAQLAPRTRHNMAASPNEQLQHLF